MNLTKVHWKNAFFTSFKANDKMQPKTWNEAHWNLQKPQLKSQTKSYIETLFQFATILQMDRPQVWTTTMQIFYIDICKQHIFVTGIK
jgi:hypothetical protein